MRKKIIINLGLILILIFTLLPRVYAYTNLNFSVVSPYFTLKNLKDGYTLFELPGFINVGTKNQYLIPRKNIKVLIPNGSELVSYKITRVKKRELNGTYKLPVGENPINESGEAFKANEVPNKILSPLNLVGMENERGVKFLVFTYYPFLYNGAKLTYIEEVSFSITLRNTENKENIYIKNVSEEEFINYYSFDSFYKDSIKNSLYDYLIITIDKAKKLAEEHKRFLESRGIKTKVVTLSEISDTGNDDAESIRNFIKREYEGNGIKYVLLIGSLDSIPMRYMYTGEEGDEENSFIPTDFYYRDLTGDWDSNGDGYFGVPGEDDLDFHPEVSVGRIPFDNLSDIKNILDKTRRFMDKSEEERKKKILSLGAWLSMEMEDGRWEDDTDGGEINQRIFDLYFKNKGFTNKGLYELSGMKPSPVSDSADDEINAENVVVYQKNYEPALVQWEAHGAWNSTARKIWVGDYNGNGQPDRNEFKWKTFISNEIVRDFNDESPAIFISGSCLNLYPDRDSLGKNIVSNGGVSFIGNSRTGWFLPNVAHYPFEQNPSHYSLRAMTLKSLSEGKAEGDAINEAIKWYADSFYDEYPILQQILVHNIYDLNLFGDSIVGLYTLEEKQSNPQIIDTYLEDSDSDVPTNISIKVKFDRSMDDTTINRNSFLLSHNNEVVDGEVSYKDNELTAYFTPKEQLKKGSLYTVTIKNTIKDREGNPLASDFTFSFTTVGRGGQTGFILQWKDKDEGYEIDLESLYIKYDRETITFKITSYRNWGNPETDFYVGVSMDVDNNPNTGKGKDSNGNGEDYLVWLGTYNGKFYHDVNKWDDESKIWRHVEDVLNYKVGSNSNVATFTISRKYFQENRFNYWVGIYDEVNDEFDYYPEDDYYVTFTFEEIRNTLEINEIFPEDNATVKPDTLVYVVFSDDIVKESLNDNTFFVMKGRSRVLGKIEYNENLRKATFIPESSLEDGKIYEVHITKDVVSKNGANLQKEYTWRFRVKSEVTSDWELSIISPRGVNKSMDISRVYIKLEEKKIFFKVELYSPINNPLISGFVIRMDTDNNPNTGVPLYPNGGNGEDYTLFVGGKDGKLSGILYKWVNDSWEEVGTLPDFELEEGRNYAVLSVNLNSVGDPKVINYWVGVSDDPEKFAIIDRAPNNSYFATYQIVGKKGWIHQFTDIDEGTKFDLKDAYAMHDETEVYFKISTYRGWSDPYEDGVFFEIDIDADQNSETGNPDGMGEDFYIGLYPDEDGIMKCVIAIYADKGWQDYQEIESFKINKNSNTVEINFPRILIGNPEKFNYWIGVGYWYEEGDKNWDYYPNDDDPFYYIEYDLTKKLTQPALPLEVDIPDNYRTDKDSILIKGRADSESTVEINGEEVLVSSSGIFAKIVKLNPGENLINIKAYDPAGNTAEVKRRVIYEKKSIIIELWIGKREAKINGNEYMLDAPPFIENGRTLVPIRFIAEGFGAKVDWIGETKTVIINLESEDINIVLQIGSKIAIVDGEKIILDVAPKIVNGRTFVPLRFVAETFGAEVLWNGTERKITITFKP